MERRSPFAAAGMVLGAVACIIMLAMLAARGGGGDSNQAPDGPKSGRLTPPVTDSPVTDAERVAVQSTDLEINPHDAVEGCVPVTYLYTGANIVPADPGSATPPYASLAVSLVSTSGEWRFRSTPACGAVGDSSISSLSVIAGQQNTVTFPAP